MTTQSVELPVQSYQSPIYLLCTDSADNGDPTRTGPARHLASAGGNPVSAMIQAYRTTISPGAAPPLAGSNRREFFVTLPTRTRKSA